MFAVKFRHKFNKNDQLIEINHQNFKTYHIKIYILVHDVEIGFLNQLDLY
jgi:hypothetical protein